MSTHSIDQQQESARPAHGRKGRLAALLGLFAITALSSAARPVLPVPLGLEVHEAEVEWIVAAEDSVCGVLEPRQIRKPAKVDFKRLMKLTPELKKMKRKRIDPDSAEGVRLTNQAKSRVRDASSAIMKRQGYDSVWKNIRSRRGTHVADVTAYVEIEMGSTPSVCVDGAI